MRNTLSVLAFAFLCAFLLPSAARAQIVTTPYWCGSYWSSYPCNAQPYAPSYQNYYGQNQYQYQTQYQYPYQYPQYYQQYSYPTYQQTYPCGYYYTSCAQTPVIYSVAPSAGTPGTTVTVNGAGFTSSGNSVRFGNGIIANLFSSDGRTLSFVIPMMLSGFNSQYATPGTYNLTVTNSDGRVSNSVQFTIPGWYYSYPQPYPASW